MSEYSVLLLSDSTVCKGANGTHVYNKNDTPNEVLVNANGDKTMLYNCSECGAIGVVAVVVKAPVAALPGDDD